MRLITILLALVLLLAWASEPLAADQPITGARLVVSRTDSGREKLVFLSKDEAIASPAAGGGGDPTINGVTIELLSMADGLSTAIEVPNQAGTARAEWKDFGVDYKFVNRGAPNQVTSLRLFQLKDRSRIRIVARAAALPLGGPSGALAIRITMGDTRYCARFDPSDVRRDRPGHFSGKRSDTVDLADCTGAALVGETLAAFPGATGFGAGAAGGRPEQATAAGEIIAVTTLDDSGPGSLRECVQRTCAPGQCTPRICVFRVGGTIRLTTESLTLQSEAVTIAGQTAPGPVGIVITSDMDQDASLVTIGDRGRTTGNIVLRYLTLASGRGPNVTMLGARDVILDHISIRDGMDRNFNISTKTDVHATERITLQRTLLADPFLWPVPTGSTAYGVNMFMTGDCLNSTCGGWSDVSGISLHHNLFANATHRNPLIQRSRRVKVVNNLVANWRDHAFQTRGDLSADFIANHLAAGPATRDDPNFILHATCAEQCCTPECVEQTSATPCPPVCHFDCATVNDPPEACDGACPDMRLPTQALEYPEGEIFVADNIANGEALPLAPATASSDQWGLVRRRTGLCDQQETPHPALHIARGTRDQAAEEVLAAPHPTRVLGVTEVRCNVLQDVGNRHELTCDGRLVLRSGRAAGPDSDPDCRVLRETALGDGPAVLGEARPPLPLQTPGLETRECEDTDADGLPDAFEAKLGLPIGPNDAWGDHDDDGYRNIEEYLNGMFGVVQDSPCAASCPDGD